MGGLTIIVVELLAFLDVASTDVLKKFVKLMYKDSSGKCQNA